MRSESTATPPSKLACPTLANGSLPAANNARFSLGVDRESSLLAQILPAASQRFSKLPIGGRLEISPDSSRIVRRVGEIMAEGGGAGLVIDYGGDKSFSNSIRGFKSHKIVDIFAEPGTADLTANVDFAYLRESLQGVAETAGPVTQAKFLLALGLEPRLAKLLSSATDPEQKKRIQHSAQRLIDTTGMGTQYQVMAIVKGKAGEDDVYPFAKPVKAAEVAEPVADAKPAEEAKPAEMPEEKAEAPKSS